MGWFRSPRRWPALLVALYVAIVVVGNVTVFAGVVLARVLGHSPEVEDDLPEIQNLRRVDERVYASGQPDPKHYQVLAEKGFTLVIDLRTHTKGDPKVDDPSDLEGLGIDYLHVPVRDGRAPDEASVARVLDAISGATGRTLVHCGGGVGRSSSLAASYLASQGKNPSVLDQLGVGPPSLEQIYFVAATGSEDEYAENDFVNSVSRYVVDGPRRLWHSLTGG